MIALSQALFGKTYRIEEIRLSDLSLQMQFASMGFVKSATVQKIRNTPFGDPVEYLLDREQLLALDNALAASIWVSEMPAEGAL